jgi:hypothetical protein
MFVSTFLSVLVTRGFVKNQVYRQSSVHPNRFIETNLTMPRPTCEAEIHLMWNKSKTCVEHVQLAMGSTFFLKNLLLPNKVCLESRVDDGCARVRGWTDADVIDERA